jgi:hypothetical protein
MPWRAGVRCSPRDRGNFGGSVPLGGGAELIPAHLSARMLPSSRPVEGSISRRSCIEGGLQVGYTWRHARHDYLRLAAPTDCNVGGGNS